MNTRLTKEGQDYRRAHALLLLGLIIALQQLESSDRGLFTRTELR